MHILFSAREIVTMAIEIERKGIRFYTAMGEKSDAISAGELFRYLADEEVKHEAAFQKMLKGMQNIDMPAEEQKEYDHYLGALTSSRIFNRENDMDSFVSNLDESAALDIAIEAEKDSILFYYELLNQSLPEDKDDIMRVINEEKTHYVKLVNLKNEITK